MRFFIIVLALSTLAVAGPLPYSSKNALKARAQASTLANNTLDLDSIAALSKLKATYDSLNNQAPGLKARSSDSISASANITLDPNVVAALNELKVIYDDLNKAEHNSTSVAKRDFDSWFQGVEDKLAEEGLWPRSSTVENYTLSPESIAALTKLKAEYDSHNEKRMESDLTKRGFWHWVKMTLEAPGLKARSLDSTSMAPNCTLDPDTIAALNNLKARYNSLNQKRAEKDLAKRGFWHWVKMMIEAPGLKARSAIPDSTPANITLDADSVAALTKLKAVYDSFNEKRTDSGVVVKRGFWYWLIHGTPNKEPSNASEQDDTLKEKRTDNGVVGKRGLLHWLKQMYGTPPNVQISSR